MTKAVVQQALQDRKVDDSQFKLLILPSLELLGAKLVSVDPYAVLNQNIIG